MSFAVIGIVGVTWTVCGWSFAYGGDGFIPFFGGFDQIGLQGLVAGIVSEAPEALSHDAYPAMADVVFQLAFCMITTAIITGAVAGRMKFGAVCAFVAVWTVVVYPPLAHMVWGGEGSLVGDTIGALDFAGGDVVHISSGLTGLILCLIAGKRRGFGMVSYRPHNVPFVALGATLLWFGWFGFSEGDEAGARVGLADIVRRVRLGHPEDELRGEGNRRSPHDFRQIEFSLRPLLAGCETRRGVPKQGDARRGGKPYQGF